MSKIEWIVVVFIAYLLGVMGLSTFERFAGFNLSLFWLFAPILPVLMGAALACIGGFLADGVQLTNSQHHSPEEVRWSLIGLSGFLLPILIWQLRETALLNAAWGQELVRYRFWSMAAVAAAIAFKLAADHFRDKRKRKAINDQYKRRAAPATSSR